MSEIVISGISGKFPNAGNIQELSDKLFDKVYLVSDSEKRFKCNLSAFPKSVGLIDGLDKCDASGTRTSLVIIKTSDPQLRLLSEIVNEAVYDAGFNMEEIKNSNTGVYVGCSNYDALAFWHTHQSLAGMASVANSAYSMSNRISYMLDSKGPSMTIDTACSSSFYALNAAVNDIKAGKCDAAVVAGSNLILHPMGMEEGVRNGVLTREGVSQPFDKNSSGFIRSEAICAIILQKVDDARRNYASVVNIKTANDGFKIQGATVPSQPEIEKLLKATYKEANINPSDINFIESHAASTFVGDKIQVDTLSNVFCEKSRKKPLKIGSIKSNTGHTESASGIVSLAKVLLMFENNKIIPNINIKQVRDDCEAFVEGKIKVATEVEEFHDELIGIDNFGILGANSHCILRKNTKTKIDNGFPKDKIPRLVLYSSKASDTLTQIFNTITESPIDDEFIALLQKSQNTTSTTAFRGFGIFKSNESDRSTICVDKSIIEYSGKDKRPIVFLFSGVGSQWLSMGKSLQNIPLIAEKIETCHQVLESKNVNLKHILYAEDAETFKNCLNIFVGIVSIQIALTDVLKAIGIKPEYIIGHSIGELACAYSDGSLTLEQTMLAAYARGSVINSECRSEGRMAAIAMKFDDLQNTLTNGIEIACHNSHESFTISGDATEVETFVADIKKTGVLAKVVDSAGVAFHSSHMRNCDQALQKLLEEIIDNPVKRSEKWISTSVLENVAEYADADYFKNNLLNPVRFSSGMEKLPKNALVVEIAPHGLLQGIVKQNISECEYIGLTHRNTEDSVVYLLQALGKIALNGHDMDIREIYPKIEFPVSRGTKMISPLIRWNHNESHFVPYFDPLTRFNKRDLTINLYNTKFANYSGHQIDGQIILPATGYVELVWETFAMMHGRDYWDFPVAFDQIKFLKAVILSPSRETELSINIQIGSGSFEVQENNESVCSGSIKKYEDKGLFKSELQKPSESDFTLERDDFYKTLRLRGYEYLEVFRCVKKMQPFCENGFFRGKIEWNSDWTCFIDNLAQLSLFEIDSRELALPTEVRKIIIDPILHFKKLQSGHSDLDIEDGKSYLTAEYDPRRRTYTCGGVKLVQTEVKTINRRKHHALAAVETFKFVPHFPTPKLSLTDAISICCQLFCESINSFHQYIVEIDAGQKPLLDELDEGLSNLQFSSQECFLYSSKEKLDFDSESITLTNSDKILSEANLLIIHEPLSLDALLSHTEKLTENYMIIFRATKQCVKIQNLPEKFKLIAEMNPENEKWFIFIKSPEKTEKKQIVYEIPSDIHNFSWVEDLKTKIHDITVFYGRSKGNNLSGIDGFYKSVIKDYNIKGTQCIFVDDDSAPEFDLNNPFYANQLNLGLQINVYKNGCWGSYRNLELPIDKEPKLCSDHVFVNVTNKGDLNTVHWLNGSIDPKSEDEKLVKIHYGSLNFKDILIGMKRIQQDPGEHFLSYQYNSGLEYSGIDKYGHKVIGCLRNRAISNFCTKDDYLTFYANKDWTLDEAATVPLSYSTVYLSFFHHAHIEAGESILIHSGTGGLGQAAIHTALTYGLKVYATVGSEERKKILLELFPQLCPDDIGNSHDTSFEQMIQDRTNGKGVNYVLNSLAEDKLHASVRCLSLNGTFLEVGRYDMENGSNFNMKNFLNQINFKTIYLSLKNIREMTEMRRNNLLNKIQEDITTGKIKPITRTIFDANDVQKAFRYLSANKHIGKVLIKVRENENSKVTLPIELKPRVNFHPHKSYIITGGLGGMGMELAEWMILRDCRKLILVSRRGIANSYQGHKIKLWEKYGAEIFISTADITTKAGCQQLIDESIKMGPVGGIFSLAAVLNNEYFANLTPTLFANTFYAKAHAAIYLDEISRTSCPELDHFLVFSSVASGRGAITQSNYAMANCVTEKLVERRNADGLPGKAIEWGPVAGIGMLETFEKQSFHGLNLQPIASCLELLDSFFMSSEVVCCSWHYSEKVKFHKKDSFFDILVQVLGIGDWRSISDDSTLSDIGVDSMSGTEIQHILGRDFGIDISLKDLRMKTVGDLKTFLK